MHFPVGSNICIFAAVVLISVTSSLHGGEGTAAELLPKIPNDDAHLEARNCRTCPRHGHQSQRTVSVLFDDLLSVAPKDHHFAA